MPTPSRSNDAITLLRTDHRKVKALFRQFERMHRDGGLTEDKRKLCDSIVKELNAHAFVEEIVFYPMVRNHFVGMNDFVLESVEEHHVVRNALGELLILDLSDERYDAKMMVMMALVRRHIHAEERETFPAVREKLGRKQLQGVGAHMVELRKQAPAPSRRVVGQPLLEQPRVQELADRDTAAEMCGNLLEAVEKALQPT